MWTTLHQFGVIYVSSPWTTLCCWLLSLSFQQPSLKMLQTKDSPPQPFVLWNVSNLFHQDVPSLPMIACNAVESFSKEDVFRVTLSVRQAGNFLRWTKLINAQFLAVQFTALKLVETFGYSSTFLHSYVADALLLLAPLLASLGTLIYGCTCVLPSFGHCPLPLNQSSQDEHQNPRATPPVSQLVLIECTVLPPHGDEHGTRPLGFSLDFFRDLVERRKWLHSPSTTQLESHSCRGFLRFRGSDGSVDTADYIKSPGDMVVRYP
jgi:hypothetical protein